MRMHQKDRQNEDRRKGQVQKRQQRPRDQKAAHLLQIAERLVFLPIALQRGPRRRRKDRRPQPGRQIDRTAQQHAAPDGVEHHLQQHRPDDHHGQHDQCIDRTAGQHPVRDLEQIDRDRQHQQVRDPAEQQHAQDIDPDAADRVAQRPGDLGFGHPLVKAGPGPRPGGTRWRLDGQLPGLPLDRGAGPLRFCALGRGHARWTFHAHFRLKPQPVGRLVRTGHVRTVSMASAEML